MRIKQISTLFSLCLFLLISCQSQQSNELPEVVVYGKLMEIMRENQLQARVQLEDLSMNSNTFGLGAIEGLAGEILIWEGKSLISKSLLGQVSIEESVDYGAALLVITEAEGWNEFSLSQVSSFQGLEAAFEEKAITLGYDSNAIIPFRISGKIDDLDWHVINAVEASEPTHEAYKAAGFSGQEKDKSVEILGFYSKNHQGVFTHHGSFVHLHFIDREAQIMGHVDGLKFSSEVKFYLPKSVKP